MQTTLDLKLTTIQQLAAPGNSNFSVQTVTRSLNVRTGDAVYAVARLTTASGRPVYVTTNVVFTVTGALAWHEQFCQGS